MRKAGKLLAQPPAETKPQDGMAFNLIIAPSCGLHFRGDLSMKVVPRLKLQQIAGCSTLLSFGKTTRDLERAHCKDRWARGESGYLLRWARP